MSKIDWSKLKPFKNNIIVQYSNSDGRACDALNDREGVVLAVGPDATDVEVGMHVLVKEFDHYHWSSNEVDIFAICEDDDVLAIVPTSAVTK